MRIKNLIALVLSLVLVCAASQPISATSQMSDGEALAADSALAVDEAAQKVCGCEYTPIIYVRGRAAVYADKDKAPTYEDGGDNPSLPYISDEKLEEMLKKVVPIYAECYVNDDFEPFRKEITACFAEVYADYALDKNGNPTNNSGLLTGDYWRNKPLYDNHMPNGEINTPEKANNEVYKYFFQYDGRLDPCEIAHDLRAYIEAVKEITGHSKIKVIARCQGTNILTAYFAEYGWEDIEDVLLYNAIVNGTAITNSLFSGELYFDADAVDFFATQSLSGDMTILDFICDVITMANKTYGLDMLMDYFNMTATKVARMVVPDIMRVSYGTTPGYWSMVSDEYYVAARDYIFDGVEDEWAGLIKKLDYYHGNVGVRTESIYKEMKADGVNVYNISKYGYQLYPIMKDAARQSDQIVTVEQQAPGTTSAQIGYRFGKEYMLEAEKNGTAKYISRDGAIDASTGLFPDTTWYVKNLEHNNFPWLVDELMYEILRSDGEMTVFTNEKYPQYLIYEYYAESDTESMRPMTEADPGYTLEEPDFFDLLADMFEHFFELLGELFDLIVEKIKAL